ncbi:MAG: hypothetical protein ACFFBD_26770, partial [Candidatus Hodarchaeota archaeon]
NITEKALPKDKTSLWEKIDPFKQLLAYPISAHPQIQKQSFDIIDALFFAGINTIFKLYTTPLDEISKKTNIPQESLKKILTPSASQILKNYPEKALKLDMFDSKTQTLLKESNVTTFEEFYFTLPDSLQKEKDISHKRQIVDCAVSYFPNLPKSVVKTLAKANMSSVARFLLFTGSELNKISGLSQKKLSSLKDSFNFQVLEQSYKDGISVLELGGIGEKSQKELNKFSLKTVPDMFFIASPDNPLFKGIKQPLLQKIQSAFNCSLITLDDFSENPSALLTLKKSNIMQIIDVIIWDESELAKLSGFSLEKIKSIKSALNINNILKRNKSAGTSLSAYLDEQTIEFLETNRIFSLEGLYFSSEDFASLANITPEMLKEIKEACKFLEESIDQHPSLSPKNKEKLKSSNISTILEFLLTPRKEIISITKLPKKQVNDLKKTLRGSEEAEKEEEDVTWPTSLSKQPSSAQKPSTKKKSTKSTSAKKPASPKKSSSTKKPSPTTKSSSTKKSTSTKKSSSSKKPSSKKSTSKKQTSLDEYE